MDIASLVLALLIALLVPVSIRRFPKSRLPQRLGAFALLALGTVCGMQLYASLDPSVPRTLPWVIFYGIGFVGGIVGAPFLFSLPESPPSRRGWSRDD